jgi:hypothetical protein
LAETEQIKDSCQILREVEAVIQSAIRLARSTTKHVRKLAAHASLGESLRRSLVSARDVIERDFHITKVGQIEPASFDPFPPEEAVNARVTQTETS